jgi:hypothetical protein
MNRPMPTFLDQEVIATSLDEAVEDKSYDFALVKIGREFNKDRCSTSFGTWCFLPARPS